MYTFDEEKPIAEALEGVFAAIEKEKSRGFLIVSSPSEEKREQFVREFMRAGYHVSQPISTGKTAIVWDDSLVDGFLKSGFSFEQAVNPEQ